MKVRVLCCLQTWKMSPTDELMLCAAANAGVWKTWFSCQDVERSSRMLILKHQLVSVMIRLNAQLLCAAVQSHCNLLCLRIWIQDAQMSSSTFLKLHSNVYTKKTKFLEFFMPDGGYAILWHCVTWDSYSSVFIIRTVGCSVCVGGVISSHDCCPQAAGMTC